MKHFWAALLPCCAFLTIALTPAASAGSPVSVSQCFKVNRLLRLDSTHYWADWTNACPYTIESVYVKVGFLDHSRKQLGEGVWPMYFVLPGVHRVTRFSVPVGVATYETIRVSRITSDATEGLATDKREIDAAEHQAPPPGIVADNGVGRVIQTTVK